MRALWLEDRTPRLRSDVPHPTVPQGEVLVRVLRAGICNTDLELIRGYYPYRGVLGHEFVGVVESGPERLRGRRVVGEINAVCHTCATCRAGRPTHCERRTVLGIVNRDGAFADYLTLPAANLHPVPDGVETDAAVFVEPLAAALEIQEQISITADDRVLVVGDGKLGLLIAQTLALGPSALTVVGKHDDKLSLIRARGVATAAPDDIRDGTFDVAVECTGNPGGFALALLGVRPRGTLVLKSTYADPLTVDAAAVVVNELTVVGSRCGPFRPALELLQRGSVDVTSLIHARYPLSDALVALERAAQPGVLKVLLDIGN